MTDRHRKRKEAPSTEMTQSEQGKAAANVTRRFDLRRVGPRQNVLQIVPPRNAWRHSVAEEVLEDVGHELFVHPLESPTGPHGAKNFRNVAGSQIAVPHVTNVYLGEFWAGVEQRAFFEEFSKAIVENGYLDPLAELGYGSRSGVYLGAVQTDKPRDNTFADANARQTLRDLIDQGVLHADENSVFFLILPSGVRSVFPDGSASCSRFCGYHDAFTYQGVNFAYAVMPSSDCQACGNGKIGAFTATYAHELAEAITDKVPGMGWVSQDGKENGDLEAWILLPWGPPNDPKRFVVQSYYTNERGPTIGAWRETIGSGGAVVAEAAFREARPGRRATRLPRR